MECRYISKSVCKDRDFSSVGVSLSWIFLPPHSFSLVPKHMGTSPLFSRTDCRSPPIISSQVSTVSYISSLLWRSELYETRAIFCIARHEWKVQAGGWSPSMPPSRCRLHQLSISELSFTEELGHFCAGCPSSYSVPHLSVMYELSSM